LVAVSDTVNVPAAEKVWFGFCADEFAVPSPKLHSHEVGVFVEVSVNDTLNGATPDDGV
jgi:hypothetical protein